MAVTALPGFRDVFPDALARRRRIFAAWRDIAARYGFEEYDGPPLEPVELYTKKSGEEIVEQLYSFTDKGDRVITLRPEMTPTLARMVAQRAAQLKKPIRWFSIPQLFRYERQQRGRLREHFQLNMDIIGEAGPLADAEVIAAAVDILRALGFGPADVRARVSDRRVLTTVLAERHGVTEAELPGVLAALDRHAKSPEAAEAGLAEALGASGKGTAGRAAALLAFFEGLSDPGPLLALEAAAPLRECVEALGAMGLGAFVDVDFRIVRGLAYYTGIVFELFDAGRSLRAICGGGRYDNLLKQVGGVDLPCVGFGMGDVVLGELLKARGKLPATAASLDYWVAYEDSSLLDEAQRVATRLRRAGHSAEYGFKHGQLGKQLDTARKAGAKAVVIVKPDRTLRLKDFASGNEGPFTLPNG